jgi:hypothetical protein
MHPSNKIVDFTPLYCRFIAAIQPDFQTLWGCNAEPLFVPGRDCSIRQSGGVQ